MKLLTFLYSINTLMGYKFCIHCQHSFKPNRPAFGIPLQKGLDMDPEWMCRKFLGKSEKIETVDMVSGRRDLILTEFVPCKVARINDSMCGLVGTYFENHDIKNIDE